MPDTPRLTPARQAERTARDKRLAEALRVNLRRRKEQARARDDRPSSPGGTSSGPERSDPSR